MMRILKSYTIFILLLFSFGLKAQSVSELKAKIASLETKVLVLETKVSMLEENNKALNQRIDQILLNFKSTGTGANSGFGASNIPQNSNQITNSTTSEPVQTKPATSYGRCGATTKKGTQCSRSAKSNGYCWQHGGY